MFNQKNLTCYWGNREELTDKQRKIIKELGYTYRGKNQWLYFLSFEPGYYPYNIDEEEVLRMSEYMQNLESALKCYEEEQVQVDFEHGAMFHIMLDEEKKIKGNAVLEADVSVLGASVTDKKYDRPANPTLSLLGDANTGTVIKFEMVEPEEDAIEMLAEILIGFIFQFGAPKEIRVSNVIVEAGLEQICNVCGINLRRVKRLQGLDEFMQSMHRFRM